MPIPSHLLWHPLCRDLWVVMGVGEGRPAVQHFVHYHTHLNEPTKDNDIRLRSFSNLCICVCARAK